MNTTSTIEMIESMVADVGTILTSGLASVLGLVAILIGLFFIVRLITKKIGKGI